MVRMSIKKVQSTCKKAPFGIEAEREAIAAIIAALPELPDGTFIGIHCRVGRAASQVNDDCRIGPKKIVAGVLTAPALIEALSAAGIEVVK